MVKFPIGTRVKAKYLATKLGPFAAVQYKEGAITKVLAELKEGKPVYEITYDDKTSAGENVVEERVYEKFIKALAAAAGSSSPAPAPAAAAPKKAAVVKSPPKAKATAPKDEAKAAATVTPDVAVVKPAEPAPVAETPAVAAKPTEPTSKEKKSAGPTEATNKQRPVTKPKPKPKVPPAPHTLPPPSLRLLADSPLGHLAQEEDDKEDDDFVMGESSGAGGRGKRARKQVNYSAVENKNDDSDEEEEMDEDEEEAPVKPKKKAGKSKIAESDDDWEDPPDEKEKEKAEQNDDDDDDAEESEEEEEEEEEAPPPKKAAAPRKPAAKKPAAPRKPAAKKAPVKKKADEEEEDDDDDDDNDDDDDDDEMEDEDDFAEDKKSKPKKVKPADRSAVWNTWGRTRWTDEETEELPVLTKPQQMFDDMVTRLEGKARVKGAALEGHSLSAFANKLAGRKLRVATMCSGTESPVLALDMICKSLLKECGAKLEIDHVFSCEIEPFKQAYIERNFAPPRLFRDIRELGQEEATTAYGSLHKVPGDCDILIAGTSCVDFSNLNTKQQTLGADKGESSQTFFGMLEWVKRHRPSIVIQENVCGAPWQHMVDQYAEEGYNATFQRVDTKKYYIPHTRTRVYLIAVDARAESSTGASAKLADGGKTIERWMAAVEELSRPSSASMEAFLLPTDDPRVHKGREELSSRQAGGASRAAVDWGRCETRHQRCRGEEHLGTKRPLTNWVAQGNCKLPDFAWNDWGTAQVERVLDLMDINWLRLVDKGVDANYKTMLWNLSQNVDRTTGEVQAGICPCLTPNMVPYITNRGGPLVGVEVLSLQGIPVDDLLLTRESQDQMADLAGNAMSSTVVGACILSALVLRQDFLLAFNREVPAAPTGKSPKKSPAKGGKSSAPLTSIGETAAVKPTAIAEEEGGLVLKEAPLQLSAAKGSGDGLSALLRNARRSARMCVSEGRSGVAETILVCQESGTTVSAACRSTPEYSDLKPLAEPRVMPADFEDEVKSALPMCVSVSGLKAVDKERPDGALLIDAAEEKRLAQAAAKDEKAARKEAGKAAAAKKAAAEEADDMDVDAAKPKTAQVNLSAFFGSKPSKTEEAEECSSPVAARSPAKRATESSPAGTKRVKARAGAGDDELWTSWTEALEALEGVRFYFESVTRGTSWVARYAAAGGVGHLLLEMGSRGAEWQLYATAPLKRGPLRDMLLRPVARMRVTPGATAGTAADELLGGRWEVCLPQSRLLQLTVSPLGEPVDALQAAAGLTAMKWDKSTRYRRWRVDVRDEDRPFLDVDVSGEYELLEKCGGALNSLHKRVGGGGGGGGGGAEERLFLFLDPTRKGDAQFDSFVFARDFEKLGNNAGPRTSTIGELPASWRPWDESIPTGTEKEPASKRPMPRVPAQVACAVKGQWRPLKLSFSQVEFSDAVFAAPPKPLQLSMGKEAAEDKAPAAVQVLRCKVPLSAAEAKDWPSHGEWADIPLARSKATFEAIAFITDRLRLPKAISEGWASLDAGPAIERWIAGGSPCEHSAPSIPKLSWVNAGRGKLIAIEDPVQAGQYEQRLKHRPQPFVVQRRADAAGGAGLQGSLRVAVNPTSLVLRALATLPPGQLGEQAELTWRVVPHIDERLTMKPLALSSNKRDAQAPQPPHFKAFEGRSKKLPVLGLRKEQQRSLSWMLAQESADAPPFYTEEVAEATLPALGWRLEAKARLPNVVRGGVLADEVGYGKTVITIALIDSAPREPIPPPPPLPPNAFIPIKATLVLAPSHLLKQWPREIEKFSGGALKTATISTMADLNKLTIRDLQRVDVVVCAITLFRNDLYYSRLANLAGGDKLPAKGNQRHFEHAYQEAMRRLGDQTELLSAKGKEGLGRMREAVKEGQARRKDARENKGSEVLLSLGNTDKRMYGRGGGLLKGKKATYAAEKRAAKKGGDDDDEMDDAGEEEDEDEEEVAKPAAKGKGKAAAKKPPAKKKAAKKAPPKKKAKRAADSDDEDDFLDDDDSEAEEEESDDFDEDADSEDEAPKKRKKPAAKKAAGKTADEKEEQDPWGLNTSNVNNNWGNLKAPPLEMFYWNRLVVDEYTYNNDRDQTAIVQGLKSNARWVLSGTPNVSSFNAVSTIAEWLGLHLGSLDSSELSKAQKKDQSAMERFQAFKELKTWAWHAARHESAQRFLDRFVRQNIAEIDEIPWKEQAVVIGLPPAERALYIELKNHLEALDMKNNHKTIKSKCKSENDRESRLAKILGGSETPDEALLKRCAQYDISGTDIEGCKTAMAACDHIVGTRQQQLQLCKEQIVKQTAYARDAIAYFEDRNKKEKLKVELVKMPREHFDLFRHREMEDCGEEQAGPMVAAAFKEGMKLKKIEDKVFKLAMVKEKTLKDEMAWTRDQVHLLRRLQKELTARIRSLRFFENVRMLQKQQQQQGAGSSGAALASPKKAKASSSGAPPKSPAPLLAGRPAELEALPTSGLALLSCCGHMGRLADVREAAERQECVVAGCKAAVRPTCVLPCKDLGVEGEQPTTSAAAAGTGAKLSAVVRLITGIPKEERILVFVQFVDLLQKVHECLVEAGVPTAILKGTANQRSTTIEAFQTGGEVKKGEPRVLLLNLRDESAAGANLTAANHAIFLHPLLVGTQQEFDACDTQAVGRIRRYGQSRTVRLYRYLVDNSIDTDIFRTRRADADKLIADGADPTATGSGLSAQI